MFSLALAGISVSWLFADEPGNTRDHGAVASNTLQQTASRSGSWDEADTPASALSLSFGRSGERPKVMYDSGDRLVVRSRHDAYLDFHQCTHNGMVPGSMPWQPGRDSEPSQWLIGSSMTWYRVVSSNGVWIVPKRFLSDDEFKNSTMRSFIPRKSQFVTTGIVDACSTIGDGIGRNQDTFRYRRTNEMVDLTYHHSRTEWKLVRCELIGPTTRAKACPAAQHFREVDKPDCSSSTELDSFEKRAVKWLLSNGNSGLYFNETENEIRFVGAVSSDRCQHCHPFSGTPIRGAMSYRLERVDEDVASASDY
jgi:hypothetical protein